MGRRERLLGRLGRISLVRKEHLTRFFGIGQSFSVELRGEGTSECKHYNRLNS